MLVPHHVDAAKFFLELVAQIAELTDRVPTWEGPYDDAGMFWHYTTDGRRIVLSFSTSNRTRLTDPQLLLRNKNLLRADHTDYWPQPPRFAVVY